jgi:hypothetical protein
MRSEILNLIYLFCGLIFAGLISGAVLNFLTTPRL